MLARQNTPFGEFIFCYCFYCIYFTTYIKVLCTLKCVIVYHIYICVCESVCVCVCVCVVCVCVMCVCVYISVGVDIFVHVEMLNSAGSVNGMCMVWVLM